MIAIGSDHGGFEMKEALVEHLKNEGYAINDVGCFGAESCDYPVYAKKVAQAVKDGSSELGILVCGTGIGMSMCANKIEGIRAAVVGDEFSAKVTREHNDANILCMGARVIDIEKAIKFADIFLQTPFSNEERHIRRISQLEN